MPNTRKKLIELLSVTSLELEEAVTLADFLIANGVTVSPVIPGSTVYALYDRSIVPFGVFSGKNHKRNAQIVTNGCLKCARDIEVRPKKASKPDIPLLGRLVFLTKEEAEAVLEIKED